MCDRQRIVTVIIGFRRLLLHQRILHTVDQLFAHAIAVHHSVCISLVIVYVICAFIGCRCCGRQFFGRIGAMCARGVRSRRSQLLPAQQSVVCGYSVAPVHFLSNFIVRILRPPTLSGRMHE